MCPYSNDFQLKVVRTYERGEGSQRECEKLSGALLTKCFCSNFHFW